MSYFDNISKVLNNQVTLFLKEVSTKFNVPENELLSMWKSQISAEPQVKNNTPQENTLLKLNKNELMEMCKGKKLKTGGSKTDLVARLIDYEKNKNNNPFSKEANNAGGKVLSKLVEKIPVIEIKKNRFGNYEHSESALLYDHKTEKIYGKQNPDGSIAKLTKEDINTCNKYKFSYIIPDNLDTAEDDADEIVIEDEEMEDEEEEEEEEEDDEEEEEEEVELEEEYE
jgi:hypothetical protein